MLVNFPDQIEAVIGTVWLPSAPFVEDDVVILNRVPGQDIWTEDGTDTPSGTNRLKLAPSSSTTFDGTSFSTVNRMHMDVVTTGGGSWAKAATINNTIVGTTQQCAPSPRPGPLLANTPAPCALWRY